MTRTRCLGAAALAVALLAIVPATASATFGCTFVAGTLTVTQSGSGVSRVVIENDAGTIRVFNNDAEVACAGGAATTTTTNAVAYVNSGGITSSLRIIEPDSFAPGAINEGAGNSEIEFAVTESGGIISDMFLVDGDGGADRYVMGDTPEGAINFNPQEPAPDFDFESSGTFGIPALIVGSPGNDRFEGTGGFGTGNATTTELSLTGGAGNDILTGGVERDTFDGGPGDDQQRGGEQNDDFVGDPGDDLIDGGGDDSDEIDYEEGATGPVSIDLITSGPQNAGPFGFDTVAGIEDVVGTAFNDTLRGSAARNNLDGNGGDDLLEGRGDDDFLAGGGGLDTVSYESAPAGVTIDMQLESQAAGPAGDDFLDDGSLENFRGSAFADNVKGTPGVNVIDAGGGADTIDARGGNDTVLARDALRDTVNCGDGADTGVFDAPGIDLVTACESASFRDVVVLLRLGGAKKQKVKRGGVAIALRCPDEACTAAVSARAKIAGRRKTLKLKSARTSLAKNKAKSVRLKIGKGDRGRIAAALRARKKVTVTFTVTVKDALGNRKTSKRSVTLKR